MRPRGCLRPSPPSTECRGGLCACAAWRLRRGRYYLSNAADAGFARRPPPFGRYMTGAARFPSGMRPDASGGRLGRPASAGRPSTGARGVVPLPSSRQARTPYLVSRSSFREVLRGTGVLYMPGFRLASVLQAASPGALMLIFPGSGPETHSLPAAFAITHVRHGALHQLLRHLRISAAYAHSAGSHQVCSQQLREQTNRSANSKQKCPTF